MYDALPVMKLRVEKTVAYTTRYIIAVVRAESSPIFLSLKRNPSGVRFAILDNAKNNTNVSGIAIIACIGALISTVL